MLKGITPSDKPRNQPPSQITQAPKPNNRVNCSGGCPYRFAVRTFFKPTAFLRKLQHWILFFVEDRETQKSVMCQHQRRAVDAVVARCADPTRKRGLIWHTQESGKTFTLLTAARALVDKPERFSTATVVLVADRMELEGQLKGWVERLLGEMQKQAIAVERANSTGVCRSCSTPISVASSFR